MNEKNNMITIPIKPHFKKFLLKQYGAEPIKANEDTLIGKHILSILMDKRSFENHNDQYTATVRIEMCQEIRKRSPMIKNLVSINYYLEKEFKGCLYLWVQAKMGAGVNPYNATREFVEFFDFDENEYTHDAAQRAWLRHKNGEYNRKKKKVVK